MRLVGRKSVALGVAGVAAAAVVVGIVVSRSDSAQPAPHPSSPSRAPLASGCGPLHVSLSAAAGGNGASVVEAYGELTGQSQTVGPTRYRQMRLTQVRTLTGARLPLRQLVWIATTAQPAPAPADVPGLWGMDGHLLALVTPALVAHTQLGPLANTVPLVGDSVVLNAAGCWSDPDLTSTPFTGPLREVPGSGAYQLAKKFGGFQAVPMSTFLRLLNSAR